jgi:hypothetical protein
MKKRVLVLIAIIALMGVACPKKEPRQVQFNKNEILRVSVYKTGEIRADSKTVSLQELDGLLEANAGKSGVVWYYREAGTEEPPPQAMQVLNLIVKHKRPVSMTSKPDFSDTIGPTEDSVPRQR